MKILCRMHADNLEPTLYYAVVNITPEVRRRVEDIKERMKVFADMGSTFLCVKIFDYTPVYLDVLPDSYEEIAEELDNWVELPEDTPQPEGARIEYSVLRVYDDRFSWSALAKHTNVESTTRCFSPGDLGWDNE